MLKWFFDYLYWFQIFKNQCLSVPSIPVACPCIIKYILDSVDSNLIREKNEWHKQAFTTYVIHFFSDQIAVWTIMVERNIIKYGVAFIKLYVSTYYIQSTDRKQIPIVLKNYPSSIAVLAIVDIRLW